MNAFVSKILLELALLALPTMTHAAANEPHILALSRLESLPDLALLSREKHEAKTPGFEDIHAGERKLAEQFRRERKPFKSTETYRSIETCQSGKHHFPRIVVKVELPTAGIIRRTSVLEIPGSRVHEVKLHEGQFTPDELSFLNRIQD